MECIRPVNIQGQDFPCGQCRACRINRTREWATRIMHEVAYWDKTVFVTLTYSDNFLPADNGLWKRDVQLFLKRLRKDIAPDVIKYYAAGEYGDRFGRPHYHLIIFGLSRGDHDLLEGAWSLGMVHTGNVSMTSARYVTSYVQKKYNGRKATEEYGDRQPPFQTCSQGIGLRWLQQNEHYVREKLGLTVEGKAQPLPRYYRKKLGIKAEAYDDLYKERIQKDNEYYEKHSLEGQAIAKYKKARRQQSEEALRTLDELRGGKGKL
nr:MAG: replication initiator protein [Microvirus sp.]